jgi:hypothetical protein
MIVHNDCTDAIADVDVDVVAAVSNAVLECNNPSMLDTIDISIGITVLNNSTKCSCCCILLNRCAMIQLFRDIHISQSSVVHTKDC